MKENQKLDGSSFSQSSGKKKLASTRIASRVINKVMIENENTSDAARPVST